MNHKDRINSLLLKLPHKLQVRFALYCAKDVFQHVEDKDKEIAKKYLDLTEAWLGGKDVTSEELKDAASYAYASASYASAYASASASYTAASAAASAAVSYASASAAASYASASASASSAASREEKYKKYYEYLIDMFTDLEKILYDVEK